MKADFGSGHTSGGGAGRDHPADGILRDTVRVYRRDYAEAERQVEKLLARHLGGGQTRGGGAGRLRVGYKTKHSQEYDRPFSGLKWLGTRAAIAYVIYRANIAAIRAINDALANTYSEGANQTAWRISRDIEYYPLPYTEKMVEALARDNLLSLPTRTVDEDKDTAWIQKRLQAIVKVYSLRDVLPDKLPAGIAQTLVRRCQGAMDTTAQAVIYGIFDMGMYRAGLDAVAAGIAVEKTWLSILDGRVRDSHRYLHMTTLPMTALFHGLHGVLRFPHDPIAPPEEIYRCRCRMAIHLSGHGPKGMTRPIKPSEVAAYRRWRDETIDRLGGELALEMEHRRRLHGG